MNSQTLERIKDELAAVLTGRRFGKIFQLGKREFAFDFRPGDSRYLYININAGDPRCYLIARRLKDLEKASGNLSPFALTLRKHLTGAEVASVSRVRGERILQFELKIDNDVGSSSTERFVVQLTGKSANLLLTDNAGIILDRVRDTLSEGQQIGDVYSPPARNSQVELGERTTVADLAAASCGEGPSYALDNYYAERAAEKAFQEIAQAAVAKVSAEIRKREKLIGKLNADLAGHGDAEEWKRFGDLLLSNAATARREDGIVFVTDYFDDALPEVSIRADENDSITETAEKYYRRYTKARNAAAEISARIEKLSAELSTLERQKGEIDRAIDERDTTLLEEFVGGKQIAERKPRGNQDAAGSAVRRFVSSEGFEILVGKKAKDNDQLTFKIAKSLDTWMHAADYPGSHVVIRNPNRKEIPHRTLLEAAQLAAFYSQGKSQVKAAVHYTQKKFVNKPKGAAPGLVSLASFKTLLVEPKVPESIKSL